jgi:hypothetical protein
MTLEEQIEELKRLNLQHQLREIELEQNIYWWMVEAVNWNQTAIAALAKAEALERQRHER